MTEPTAAEHAHRASAASGRLGSLEAREIPRRKVRALQRAGERIREEDLEQLAARIETYYADEEKLAREHDEIVAAMKQRDLASNGSWNPGFHLMDKGPQRGALHIDDHTTRIVGWKHDGVVCAEEGCKVRMSGLHGNRKFCEEHSTPAARKRRSRAKRG